MAAADRPGERMNSLETILRQLRLAAARARAAHYAVHGLVAAVGIPLAAVLVVLAWSLRRPSAAVLMALADIRLGLKERLSTAWERRAESGPMDGPLRQDALQQAAGSRLPSAFPVRVNRGEA